MSIHARFCHALAATLVMAAWFALSPDAAAAPECTCRYAGQSYDVGTCVCMRRGSTVRVACCGRVLNNTSWSIGEEGCPMVQDLPAADDAGYGRAGPVRASGERRAPGLAALAP